MHKFKHLYREADFARFFALFTFLMIAAIYVNKARTPYFIGVPPREAQTASQTRYYFNYGIDLLHPKYDLTPEPQYLALDFPIYQALVAVVYHIFGFNEVWGKIFSVFIFLGTLIYLYLIASRYFRSKLAPTICMLLFAIFPFSFRYFPTFLVDPSVIFLSLVVLHHGMRWIDNNQIRDFLIFSFAGLLACLIKFITFIPVWIPLFVLFLLNSRRSTTFNARNRFLLVIITLTIWGAGIIGWGLWASKLNSQTTLQAFEESANAMSILGKFVGPLQIRFSPVYMDTLKRIFGEFVPRWLPTWIWIIFFVVGLLACLLRKDKAFAIFIGSYIVGWVLMFTVFFLPLSTHAYYWLTVLPIVSLSITYIFDIAFTKLDVIPLKFPTPRNSVLLIIKFMLSLFGFFLALALKQIYISNSTFISQHISNKYDYYSGMIVFCFCVALWIIYVIKVDPKRISLAIILSVIFVSSLSVMIYKNVFWWHERWWEIDRGSHWIISQPLLEEMRFIKNRVENNQPIAIVTEYSYYPHVLYLADVHGYTLTFPDLANPGVSCLSASNFPKSLAPICISLMYEQGIRDVFVLFYQPEIDMKIDEFRQLALKLDLTYIDEMKACKSDQYKCVIHYRIRKPQVSQQFLNHP